MTQTSKQVRDAFRKNGKKFSEWATENEFPYCLVMKVLQRGKARSGTSFEIALALQLIDGPSTNEGLVDIKDFYPRRGKQSSNTKAVALNMKSTDE